MKRSKGKIVFFKLLIFIGFFYTCFYFFDKIKLKIYKLKSQKSIETNNIIHNISIREKNFYIDKPSKKNTQINQEKVLTKENSSKKEVESKKDSKIKDYKYYIQIGTYSKKENALNKKQELSNYNVQILEKKVNNKIYNQVIIVGLNSREEATQIINKIPNSGDFLIRVRY